MTAGAPENETKNRDILDTCDWRELVLKFGGFRSGGIRLLFFSF